MPPAESNRFFVELVNTLSQTGRWGCCRQRLRCRSITNPPDVSTLDLSLANYDMVMTADDPVSRPDPFTGQLLPIQTANYYAQIPLNQANVGRAQRQSVAPLAGDVAAPDRLPQSVRRPIRPRQATFRYPNYFFVIGSPQGAVSEKNPANCQRDPVRSLRPAVCPRRRRRPHPQTSCLRGTART